MTKKGREFELLVAALNKSSAIDPNFVVESPGWLKDSDTSKNREIDVLITYSNGNKSSRIGIECKDLSHPVGCPEIEQYFGKIQSLDIDIPILSSASGFYNTAYHKAAALGIILQSVEQSCNFEWLDMGGFFEDIIEFRRVEITCSSMLGDLSVKSAVHENGTSVNIGNILDDVATFIFSSPERWDAGCANHTRPNYPENELVISLGGLKKAILLNGSVICTSKFKVSVIFEFHRIFNTFGYFKNRTLTGDLEDVRFAAGTSAISNPNFLSKIVVSQQDTQGIYVSSSDLKKFPSTTRIHRFLSPWSRAKDLLLIAGKRHHVNISVNSDGLSASKFLSDSNIGDRVFDGENSFIDMKNDSCSTIAIAE